MSEEHVYSVNGTTATPAKRTTLTAAGFFERQHLQEWILAHPEMLGEELLVISFEYDKWLTGAGVSTSERLDVLALDRYGKLVVGELKRDRAPDSVVVQALNYAAMVRGFSLDQLAEVYLAHKIELGTVEAALAELQAWTETISDETLAPPRVVLVAEDFGPVVTNTSLFLIEQGLDLRLVRVQLYQLSDETLTLTASQLLPVPDVEEFMVRPRSMAQTVRTTRAAAARRASIPERVAASGLLADGTELSIAPPPGVHEDRETINAWLVESAERATVTWRNDPRAPLVWAADEKPYNLTGLVRLIVEQATGAPARTQLWGPNWYSLSDGQLLNKFADTLPDAAPGRTGFDWAPLHEILSKLQPGQWTTYGDLAAVVGTAAQALGSHVLRCTDCPGAWRVLGYDGRSRPEFRFSDLSDNRGQVEVLEKEGVRFSNGAADAAQRVPAAQLNEWR